MSTRNVLTAPPEKEPMFRRDGQLSPVWSKWFRELWVRVGEEIALTNVQLENIGQEDYTEVRDDVDTLQSQMVAVQSQMVAVQNTNTAQTNEINALKTRVEAIELEPVA